MAASSLVYDEYEDILKAFVAYIVLYYLFLYQQSLTTFYNYFRMKHNKKRDENISFGKIKYFSTDKLTLTAQRTVGNTLEQSVPFLTGLFLHTVFVSSNSASNLCWLYIVTRAPYPFTFYYGVPYVSTIPGYFVVLCLFAKIFFPTLYVPVLLP